MSAPEPATNGNGDLANALSAQVDDAAVQIVLGNLDRAGQLSLIRKLAETASATGRPDIAALVNQAIASMTGEVDNPVADALVANCITQLQQSLRIPPPEDPSPSTPEPSKQESVALSEDRELLADFIVESRDHLGQVEVQMITLEKDPHDNEAINTVFRAFHTIKGLAGFLALDDMHEVAHETETLLDLARNHRLVISSLTVDVVLASADFLKVSLSNIEDRLSGIESTPTPDKHVLLNRIHSAGVGVGPPEALDPSLNPEPLHPALPQIPAQAAAPGSEWTGEERRKGEDRRARSSDTQSVRVETAKLDYLVDMAGELVIAESMVRHRPELAELHSPAVLNSLAQLARITSELQKTAMSMRMVPIGGLFQKMNRLVRDLARKTGKQVDFEAIGSETELDRNVVEELADPLMHMVRNAVDHGLEPERERIASGKSAAGLLRLRASHQAGHIVIEVADNGRGLNRDRILEKARASGLIEPTANPSEPELFELIFHPGFSTAAKVTDVSGRGVGMDVVKKKIQKLRGHVGIESKPGEGTTFSLRLPLTLAIIDGLIVAVGSERYVLPVFSVREMLRPTAEMIFTVEGTHEMAMVRGNLLPLVRLYKRFGVLPRSEQPSETVLIVAEAGGRLFCLMVDELIGKQQVVIKSLSEAIKDVPGVAGGAILGDGRVGLILDLEGIFQRGAK